MTNTSQYKWVDYVVFGLSLFLVFCFIFESFIELPIWVAWIGRWHPLILHFPIVLLLICAFLGLTGRMIPKVLLSSAVVLTLVTTISGFFLGKEMGEKGDLLFWHQWLGGALGILAALWYGLQRTNLNGSMVFKVLQAVVVGLVFATGHYGGMVTHGEDFLALPVKKRAEKIPENPFIYKDVVGRILDDKCVSCHNPNKKKGELLMTSLEGLLAGGEVGNTLIPGHPEESELIRRIHLPLEDEEHMPPEGKRALDTDEIQILERWIALGASDTLRLEHLQPSEPLAEYIEQLIQPDPMERWTALPVVADSTLLGLGSDYVTIRRIAGGINALSINVYKSPVYDTKQLTDLGPIAKNIIQMDVSGLPLAQEEVNLIASCSNLEWLEIDQTPLTDVEVDTLKVLSRLRTLKIYSTAISDESIPVFERMGELQKLYLWHTEVSSEKLLDFQKRNPNLQIETGIDPEVQASFQTSDSIPKN